MEQLGGKRAGETLRWPEKKDLRILSSLFP
jgi:hypothetical protein